MKSSMFRADWQDDPAKMGVRLRELWGYMGWPSGDKGFEVSGSGVRCPDWPPDLFALCATALRKSGAYTVKTKLLFRDIKGERVQSQGREWRASLDRTAPGEALESLPEDVLKRWRIVTSEDAQDCPLSRLADHWPHAVSLIALLVIADEACCSIGLPHPAGARQSNEPRWFDARADHLLFPTEFGSTLCRYIHPSAGRVLPKMHTAQCGLTIRSFSHNVAFCETDEVQPSWLSVPGARGDVKNVRHLNLLIAPWPEVILPGQIHPIEAEKGAGRDYHCFDFRIRNTQLQVAARLEAMGKAAQEITGSLDAVVMPELSLSPADYRAAREAMLQNGWLFICGVGNSRGHNRLNFDVPLSKHHAVHLRQRKHHRWKLDEAQIRTYGLGARLDPSKTYWERIGVQDRKLMFVVLRPWLVTTALICEDLARHDPVGELIRGIGPNLVIALLMDGPQLTGRWASRYAAGLADDPGSSVLSVTSLGMAELSRPADSGTKASRVIALWKDAFSGKPIELTLPEGHHGLVITLAVAEGEETTADLRIDKHNASFPRLAGVHPVKVPDLPFDHIAEIRQTRWISPYNAFLLSQIAQRQDLDPRVRPEELNYIREDEAWAIGHEIWRKKTRSNYAGDTRQWLKSQIADAEQAETADEIVTWDETNLPLNSRASRNSCAS